MSTDFEPTPGVGISAYMKAHMLSISDVATLLEDLQVHTHDIRTWVSSGQTSAAAALCLDKLNQIPGARILEVITATPKPEPKAQKGAGLAAAKPDPTKKPASKKSTQTRKPTETEKLRHIAEKQAQK